MSKAVLQFLEIVRNHVVQTQPAATRSSIPAIHYSVYCLTCQADTPHTCQDSGEWEIYTCIYCQHQQTYKVR